MAAIIAIDQDRPGPSVSAGTPGIARKDIWLNNIVRPRCTTTNGSYNWTLLSKPPTATATITNPNSQACEFNPDAYGSYRLQLETDGGGPGNVQILIVGVTKDAVGATANRGWLYPAVGEKPGENNWDGNTRSYAQAWEDILTDIRNIMTPGGSENQFLYKSNGLLAGLAKLTRNPITNSAVITDPEIQGSTTYTDGYFKIKSVPSKVQTSSTTPTVLGSYAIPDETHCFFSVFVTCARRTNVTKASSPNGTTSYRRTGGGAPQIVGAESIDNSNNASGGTISFALSGNTFQVIATAPDADPRNWGCEIRVQQMDAT